MGSRHYENVVISNQPYGLKIDCYKQNEKSGQYSIRIENSNVFVYHNGNFIASASAYTLRVRNNSPFID